MKDPLSTDLLLPCPFCGSETAPRLSNEDIVHHPDCECYEWQRAYPVIICAATRGGCGASSGSDNTEQKVILRWNMRKAT